MAEVYLARHGQSVANAAGIIAGHLDSPLNDIGIEQAQELGRLAANGGIRFDYVYSSPLVRAYDTATIIAESTNSPSPVIMNDLIERRFGILTGKHYTEIKKYSKKVLESENLLYFLEGDGVETFPDTVERANKVLESIEKKHPEGKVLLVTHGDIGIMLYAAFHQVPWKKALLHFHFGNSELLLLHTDSKHKPHVFEIDQRGIIEKPFQEE